MADLVPLGSTPPVRRHELRDLLGIDRLSTVEAILLAAVPSGFFGLVFADGYGRRPRVSASTVIVSTVLSIGTLAVVIALLPSPG